MDKRAARCMIRHTRYNTTGSVITRHLNFSSMFARANDTLNSHEGVIGRRPLVAYCVQWKRTYILIRFISVCIILETVKDNGSPETSVTPNSFNNRRDPEPMIHLIIKKFEMRLNDASGEINAFFIIPLLLTHLRCSRFGSIRACVARADRFLETIYRRQKDLLSYGTTNSHWFRIARNKMHTDSFGTGTARLKR